MWKPNKAGQYLYNGQCYDLESFSVTHNFEIIRGSGSRVLPPTTMTLQEQIKEMGAPWSLLSPDWQDGAPTAQQLERWKWWSILVMGSGLHSAEFSHIDDGGLFQPDESYTPIVDVIKSAPIQPDIENGPLWVPLEVAK